MTGRLIGAMSAVLFTRRYFLPELKGSMMYPELTAPLPPAEVAKTIRRLEHSFGTMVLGFLERRSATLDGLTHKDVGDALGWRHTQFMRASHWHPEPDSGTIAAAERDIESGRVKPAKAILHDLLGAGT